MFVLAAAQTMPRWSSAKPITVPVTAGKFVTLPSFRKLKPPNR